MSIRDTHARNSLDRFFTLYFPGGDLREGCLADFLSADQHRSIRLAQGIFNHELTKLWSAADFQAVEAALATDPDSDAAIVEKLMSIIRQ